MIALIVFLVACFLLQEPQSSPALPTLETPK